MDAAAVKTGSAGPSRANQGPFLRFDDSLSTVLSADTSPGFGAAATWRQLVDLLGRRRVGSGTPVIERLRDLRRSVPLATRAASARALAFASPDALLVGLFAEDELSVAAPVLRTATLDPPDWIELLPRLTPTLRSVLRHRRDLPAPVTRALQSFGPVDFVLEGAPAPLPPPAVAVEPALPPPPSAPLDESSFVALGEVARELPAVAEALRRADGPAPFAAGGYAIADLVARIDAFNRRRADPGEAPVPAPAAPADRFRFETDASGTIRRVEGVSRGPLIGWSLASAADEDGVQADGAVAGAFRRRARFTDARLVVTGTSDAGGRWRISGKPLFDEQTGRFTGYLATARRPRPDEEADRQSAMGRASVDSLRQLVHELRTPTNAIAGFAELIESQLLGPVPPVYRERAGTIRAHAEDLAGAIDDLDTAARLEGGALERLTETIDAGALIARVVADTRPLAAVRGADVALSIDSAVPAIAADGVLVERLAGRLIAAVVASAERGERIGVAVLSANDVVEVEIDRPAALTGDGEGGLFTLEAAGEPVPGAPLLGIDFALRLVRNLAGELGGALLIGADRLTLRLPAALDRMMEQATIR